MSMMGNPYYGSGYSAGSPYGLSTQYGMGQFGVPSSYYPASNFGRYGYGWPGYGMASAMPPYYASMPAQYAPIPPVPAADIVW
jgi:hypothetical protein